MYKIDLHTHSQASPDGGISASQYRQLLETQQFDYLAITDHDRIDFALKLQQELGDQIIVGQEITTTEGEIIGLFLSATVKPGQTAAATVADIKAQNAYVYIPHPFETVRKGISQATLDQIAEQVDIVEVHNGRAVFQNRGPAARQWAEQHHKIMAASSDAHGLAGLGATFTSVPAPLHATNLLTNLKQARLSNRRPPLHSLLHPKLNRVRKRWQRDN